MSILIDFGFARIGSQEVAGSSVFKGTPGFIPPEQMFEPTKATDLYAVGVAVGRIVEVVDWAVSVWLCLGLWVGLCLGL
ncbi:MAG: hypothetical protein V7K88_21380 [Nostoc sp.]|uniref:hypothetical protein n=1 Tax=Nostoc sp. TaxID=1180 RepID=UPI002FFAFC9D